MFPADGVDVETLLMYRARESGRNNLQCFTAELNARMLERLSMERRLRGAVEVQIAVDDFGTGYSSLSYLKRFPVQRPKTIARSSRTSRATRTIRRSCERSSRSGTTSGRVVAQGVESASQLAFLRANACDEMQGFHFSPPVAVHEFEKQLASQ